MTPLVRGALLSAMLVGCGGQGGGASDPGTGSTEKDVTPPQLVAKYPENTQTVVPINSEIILTFSEPLNVRRMTTVESAIRLTQAVFGEIQSVGKASRWDAQSNTLYVRPTTLFDPDRHYTVEVTNGLRDLAGNQLDTGADGVITWRFTTSAVYDDQAPVWSEGATVRAIADRFDTMTVCWWSGALSEQVNGCDASVDTLPAAATDAPSGDSNGVIYTVEYRRLSEASFTSKTAGLGAHRLTLNDLIANTEYEIRLRAKDAAGNHTEATVPAAAVATPKAGRLYVANHVGNRISMFTDAAQAVDNKAATVVTADRTRLAAPTGVAVDRDPADPSRLDPDGYVYVAEPQRNRIAAYKLRSMVNGKHVELGTYGVSQNPVPDWTIEGALTVADVTELCGPSTLRVEPRVVGGVTRKILYVANSLAMPVSYSSQPCKPDEIVVFDVTTTQGTNQAPIETIKRQDFRTPIAFAVDKTHKLLYVANRDDVAWVGDNQGGKIDVYDLDKYNRGNDVLSGPDLADAPSRSIWGVAGGPCVIPANEPDGRICGPTAIAYDSDNDRLFLANRGKQNMLVFNNVSWASGGQTPAVVQGADTGLDGVRPVGMFLDSITRRLYITSDTGQSVLIFDADAAALGGNVRPLRVIQGTKTMLGQPAANPANQSRGPFAITVARKTVTDAAGLDVELDEAYVVTPGIFSNGLTPVPTLAAFDVSVGADPPMSAGDPFSTLITNTVPDRVVVDPLLGASAVALDAGTQRLYVASFHANTIAVYNDPLAFSNGQRSPDRVIAGPSTLLDHPVALMFRRDSFEQGVLYVVNQSSHTVAAFREGDGTTTPLLTGNVAPTRYIGPPEGADPFDANANLTQLAAPTGLALDPDRDIVYVSNRDETSFQDLVGRRIVAFTDATNMGSTAHNVAPTWKIQGATVSTDKTMLRRPAGLWLIPGPDPADDRLVVANRDGGTILIFKGVSALAQAAASGSGPSFHNQPPTWAVSSSSLVAPIGLAYDGLYRDLYVSDSNRVLAITLPENEAPSAAPRVIQGSGTGLSGPMGLALDPDN